MKTIISASRRTDIPHYFMEWFRNRRKVGYVEFRNAFGVKGAISLDREDVAGYLFWTKYAKPFHRELAAMRKEEIPCAVQYTITGLGTSTIEPHIPRTDAAVEDFLKVRESLPASSAIQWRYDPLVLSNDMDDAFHLERFAAIAKALEGATGIVNTSFTEPYVRSIRRLKDQGDIIYRPIDPSRHKKAAKGNPDLPQVAMVRATTFLMELSACAESYGMELRICSNPEFDMPKSQCASVEIFSAYGKDVVEDLRPGPSRKGCQCLRTVDIGMDNTCISGCKYCYVVTSQETALRNFNNHDPEAVMLRGLTSPTRCN